MTLTLLLADDHTIVREGLKSLLEKQPDIRIVAETDNGRDAVRLTKSHRPDIAIIDVTMPDMNGIEAARQIAALGGNTAVVSLSMHADRRFAAEMLRAGARGYLLKECAFEELLDALRAVMNGHVYLSPRVAAEVVTDYVSERPSSETPAATLTPREREVLQLLAEGHGAKEIAAILHVSASTVDTHRQHIMEKLGLHSIAELTKYAIREGLTDLEH